MCENLTESKINLFSVFKWEKDDYDDYEERRRGRNNLIFNIKLFYKRKMKIIIYLLKR